MEIENRKCICGKRRANLNNTNWSRHLASCKKVKLSLTSQSVSSFFKKSRPTSDTDYPALTNNRKETQNNVPALLNNCLIGQQNDDDELESKNPDIESSTAIEINGASSSQVVTLVPSAYKELNDLSNDPAILSQIENIDPGLISYFLKMGAAQPLPTELPDKQFPRDHNGRSFHESWYWNKRSTGEVLQRKWLSYSIKNKKIYCLYCALFARNNKPNWTRHGFSNWNKGTTSIIMHETSEAHIMASIKAAYRQVEYPLIHSMKESSIANIAFNKEIVKHLIDLTMYLGRHSLPFRGHREGWQENIRGNYKDLVLLLSKYSPVLSSYVTSVELKGRKTYNFISWQRQNQLIEAIYRNIHDVIKKEILTAVFFSISLDTTFDVSRKEQLSLVIRYINKENGTVCERLVALRETVLTTGKHLLTMLDTICLEMSLDWRTNLVGQSYDGAASMKGSYNGLQSLVKKENPCAVYVWCWAHRFNLVVVDAVSCCIEARDLFGYLETLYDFIGSSKKRVHVYSTNQKTRYPNKLLRRLKRVETTRWSSHSSSLQTVLDTYDAIIDTLFDIKDDPMTDRVSSVKAGSLLDYLLQERFLLTALIFKKIFDKTSTLSKCLQSVDIDLCSAISHVQQTLNTIKTFRKFSFTPLPVNRIRRTKKMPGEISSDQRIIDQIENFKVNTFYTILDITTTQITTRFNEETMPFFKDLSLFSHKRLREVAETNIIPKDAFKGFSEVYGKFVDEESLKHEYIQFSKSYFDFEKIMNLPVKFDDTNKDSWIQFDTDGDDDDDDGLKEIFPTMYTALSIAVTLPVSSASPERAFSKLKLVKNRLRSTMSEDRLEALMIMACELDIQIDTECVIKYFASNSSVLAKLLT
ncbi:zinc finger MYM-type protein 1-like [Metopolophium dirhodum]|uniref:zinc finger MYM-type protein 1-like n=1 Tax=Metopolophium dirhodum TaxID=44670 RepID=UPI00298FC579|nr:zinc finger MYM-type protein 1-like [Metopolophium dirhodum]